MRTGSFLRVFLGLVLVRSVLTYAVFEDDIDLLSDQLLRVPIRKSSRSRAETEPETNTWLAELYENTLGTIFDGLESLDRVPSLKDEDFATAFPVTRMGSKTIIPSLPDQPATQRQDDSTPPPAMSYQTQLKLPFVETMAMASRPDKPYPNAPDKPTYGEANSQPLQRVLYQSQETKDPVKSAGNGRDISEPTQNRFLGRDARPGVAFPSKDIRSPLWGYLKNPERAPPVTSVSRQLQEPVELRVFGLKKS